MTLDQLRKKITQILESVSDETVFTDEEFSRVDSEISEVIDIFEEELMEKIDELKGDLE